jgi:hypothetical protein
VALEHDRTIGVAARFKTAGFPSRDLSDFALFILKAGEGQ